MTHTHSTAGGRTERVIACRYVADILAGLVPSDPAYDRIHDAVQHHIGDFVGLASTIRSIRNGER